MYPRLPGAWCPSEIGRGARGAIQHHAPRAARVHCVPSPRTSTKATAATSCGPPVVPPLNIPHLSNTPPPPLTPSAMYPRRLGAWRLNVEARYVNWTARRRDVPKSSQRKGFVDFAYLCGSRYLIAEASTPSSPGDYAIRHFLSLNICVHVDISQSDNAFP